MTRTRKFALPRSAAVHVLPQVSLAPPSTNVDMLVPSVAVDFAVVHVRPPSQESCTHIFGDPDELSARASILTSMPAIAAFAGTEIP
jgi:hypothetical protein